MTVRRAAVPLLAGVLGAVLSVAGCGSSTSAAASCVGPQLALSPVAAAAGQEVAFSVEWLHSGCRDTVPSSETEAPLLDVPVEVVQGSAHAVVGTVSGTGEHFSGSLTFALPAWLRPGTAEVVLHTELPHRLPLTVVVG